VTETHWGLLLHAVLLGLTQTPGLVEASWLYGGIFFGDWESHAMRIISHILGRSSCFSAACQEYRYTEIVLQQIQVIVSVEVQG
jgi:hypothetical protein